MAEDPTASVAPTTMSFLELSAAPPPPARVPFEVVLAESGHILRVPANADLEAMRELVEVLEGVRR